MKIPYHVVFLGNSQPVLERVGTGERQVATNAEIELLRLLQCAEKGMDAASAGIVQAMTNLDLLLDGPGKKNKALQQIRACLETTWRNLGKVGE